ncbi:hypothetical protein [Pelagicoccus sp. SDUM812005]|uniref:hypothetical protein n=1 Tax=Pelagicoccus sp. SDUM812005 TaxID=3041257 RepID=UPI0028103392|nr:hypothetical protein [Pelagicoccus sp. SDUM812005]MDQ8183864.1 hypothetical protein [Pelagicoccus sp. SDUM812005]
MDPIAKYNERRHAGKRDFELYPDRLIISGKNYLSSEFKTDLPLEGIRPEKEYITCRNATFKTGFYFLIGPFIAWHVMVRGLDFDPYAEGPMLMWFAGLAGIILILVGLKKERYTCFKSSAGVTVLNVAKNRKTDKNFDVFIDLLVERIHEQNKEGEQNAAHNERKRSS